MVELITNDAASIEMGRYSPDATLTELADSLSGVLARLAACAKCCTCCFDTIPVNGLELARLKQVMNLTCISSDFPSLALPPKPDMLSRKASIEDLRETFDLPPGAATLLYEYNNAEPVCMRRKDDGSCFFLSEGLCAHYSMRPLVCRLYYCRLGSHLAAITDMIVSQGVWHSYVELGWIAEADIAHNPFLSASRYEDVLLSRFDMPLPALGERAAYLL